MFPWTLPLDLWTERARTYLGHVGVRREELMRAFRPQNGPEPPGDAAFAAEALGLVPRERAIVTGTLTPPRAAWEFWGLQETGNEITIPDPDRPAQVVTVSVGWIEALSHVRVFMKHAGLRYDELAELLRMRWIAPAQDVRIESSDPVDPLTCDTSRLRITGLAPPVLDRMHRFVRFWRRLGWTMRGLDQAIGTLKPADLDEGVLVALANIQRLAVELDLSPAVIASWYGPIATTRYGGAHDPTARSLYEQLFQAPAITGVQPAQPDIFTLDATGEPTGPGTLLDEPIRARLVAALSISEADLALLVERVAGDGDALNLDNLSRLHRRAAIARALKLSVEDLVGLVDLAGIGPFVDESGAAGSAAPGRTLAFLELVEKLRASGFTVRELDFLLRDQDTARAPVGPTQDEMRATLGELRAGLLQIRDETTVLEQPTEKIVRDRLAALAWSSGLVEQAVATISGAAVYHAALTALPQDLVSRPRWSTG